MGILLIKQYDNKPSFILMWNYYTKSPYGICLESPLAPSGQKNTVYFWRKCAKTRIFGDKKWYFFAPTGLTDFPEYDLCRKIISHQTTSNCSRGNWLLFGIMLFCVIGCSKVVNDDDRNCTLLHVIPIFW